MFQSCVVTSATSIIFWLQQKLQKVTTFWYWLTWKWRRQRSFNVHFPGQPGWAGTSKSPFWIYGGSRSRTRRFRTSRGTSSWRPGISFPRKWPAAASRASAPARPWRRRGRRVVDLKNKRYVFDPVNGWSVRPMFRRQPITQIILLAKVINTHAY